MKHNHMESVLRDEIESYNELFKQRTKKLAIEVLKLYRSHCKSEELRIIGKQLIRSSTSVAANYRAAIRARSDAEKYAKLCIVVEEADETVFWF
jgi:four helix bundle protein